MRVSLGGAVEITATERWLSEIRAGRAFAGWTNAIGGGAVLAKCQLLNPAASGITVIVYLAQASITAAANLEMYHDAAVLPIQTLSLQNLLRGGAAPLAETRNTNAAGVPAFRFSSVALVALTPTLLGPRWITELDEGQALTVIPDAANTGQDITFWWLEL